MKRITLFIICAMMAMVAIAQDPSNAKFSVVVGNFSGDYSNAQRINVLSDLAESHRIDVIEQSVYNALPAEVRSKLNARYLISGESKLTTESKKVNRIKDGVKREVTIYESKMVTQLTFTNINDNSVAFSPVFENSNTDEDRSKSVDGAIKIGQTKGKQLNFLMVQTLSLKEFMEDKFPLHGKVEALVDAKKEKAESVTANLGGRDAIYRGQTFEIVAYKKGKEKNYGKLRVREINDDSTSTLSVEKGNKEIFKALSDGEELQLVSYVQVINLNGIVRAEHEAPRLEVSNKDEVSRRNVAFGAITGGAPSQFVKAVKDHMKSNIRINSFVYGDNKCPSLDNLDGIVYGYFSDMNTTSRLVKADETLLVLKDYTEYTTSVEWYLFIVDPRTGDILYAGDESVSAKSDKSAEESQAKAIESASNITEATYSAYPLIGNITAFTEGNEKKAKEVTIDLGSNYPVYTDLRFEVYSLDANAGWEKVGRIEVSNITDGESSICTVKKGGDAIMQALNNDIPLRITTQLQKALLEL